MNTRSTTTTEAHGYAPVNGLKMYYEIEGAGDPLIFIPPAFGSPSICRGMAARQIFPIARSPSSNIPRTWLAC